MITKWQEYIYQYFEANFDIELLIAQQEANITFKNENGYKVCNYIRFPKAENGNLVNKHIIQNMVNTIKGDKEVSTNIFGTDELDVNIWDNKTSWYITWNETTPAKFKDLNNAELKKLYKYSVK